MGKFSDSLRAAMDDALKQVNAKIVEIATYAFKEAVFLSPTAPEAKWAKGEFINSWFPAENGYDMSITRSYDYYGTGSLSRIDTLANSQVFFGKDGFVSLSNNLSYANQVEYTGWIRTGPYAPARNALTTTIQKYG